MMGAYTAEQLTEILERALDAIATPRREHIYRWDYESGRKVVHNLAKHLERLSDCCRGFTIKTEETYWGVVQDCLELALDDPLNTYKRPEDPICTHDEAYGLEMYAFVVDLDGFTRPIYTKFCLKQQADETWYVSISCHT